MAAEKLSRSYLSVRYHWELIVKQILLSHLRGRLHINWKQPFLEHLMEKRVKSDDDIDWKEVEDMFPDESRTVLQGVLSRAVGALRQLPIHEALQSNMKRLRRRDQFDTEKKRAYRNLIARALENISKS